MNGKELLAELRAAPWQRPEELASFCAAAGQVPSSDLIKALDAVMLARGAAQEPQHSIRCTAFARLVSQTPTKEMFVPLVRALKVADPALRAALLPTLTPINN